VNRYARLSWLLATLCCLVVIADTVVVSVSISLFSEAAAGIHGWPLVDLASVGSSVLGAVIVATYPRHPIGWLLSLIGFTSGISLLTESYGIWVLDEGGPGSEFMGELSGLVAAVLGGPLALAALTVMFLLVPNGYFLSPAWRWVARAAVAAYCAFLLGVLLLGLDTSSRRGDTPSGNLVAEIFTSAGVILIAVLLVAAVSGMVIRLRRSEGETRQQLRVVAFGAASVGISLASLIVAQIVSAGEQTWWSSVPLFAAYVILIVCIAVAVLRYRLSDVDLIIGSAVVLACATVFVGLGYVAIVVGVGLALGSHAEGLWPSLVATVVVALAFQPLRRRVVRFADRLVYGERAAPYDALADFSRRLGDSPAPDSLLPALAESAALATQAQLVTVELEVDAGRPQIASWPPAGNAGERAASERAASERAASEPDLTVPVSDASGELGLISVYLRPGRGIREVELRLLHDFAEQAALGFRNARLEAELAAHVDMLDKHTDELAESRRRIIEAADAERRRLEASIARDVLPTMREMRSKLEQMRSEPVDPAATAALVDIVTGALEILRELTRGIYPTMLTRAGLGPALTSYFARIDRPGVLDIDESASGHRFSPRVETAAYFCCTQAVSNAADVSVRLAVRDGWLELDVEGVRIGDADRLAMIDRAEICGGSIEFDVISATSSAAEVRAWLPAREPEFSGSAG
jgi:signal transduction histidine kinase